MPRATGRRSLGQRGEALAADYLRRMGYQVLGANFRCQWGEVDIVAMDGATLVFVEVRTRRGASFGTPQESLTRRKQERLIATAETYLQEHSDAPKEWRIDLVSILAKRGSEPDIEHLRSAVQQE
ncbi:MAG: YraN family protein [Chloroflexota bacterium]|nr:YraN family protein [Chloroflexota bacterium]